MPVHLIVSKFTGIRGGLQMYLTGRIGKSAAFDGAPLLLCLKSRHVAFPCRLCRSLKTNVPTTTCSPIKRAGGAPYLQGFHVIFDEIGRGTNSRRRH